MDLTNKSNSSSGNVYTGTIPIQQAKTIQQQQHQQQHQQQQSGKAPQPNQASTFAGSASQVPITTASIPSSSSQSTLTTAASANLARRKLPRTPEAQQQQQTQLQPANLTNTPNALATNQINLAPHQQATKQPASQVLIQCWLDTERRELVVSLACAQLPRANTSAFCFGQIRILPPTL